MNLDDTIKSSARASATRNPPVTAEYIEDNLYAIIAIFGTRIRDFQPGGHARAISLVAEHLAVRYRRSYAATRPRRANQSEDTDAYFYFPAEVAFLLHMIAEGHTTSIAHRTAAQYLDWDLEPLASDTAIATAPPQYMTSRAAFDLVIGMADVEQAMRFLLPSEKVLLEAALYHSISSDRPPPRHLVDAFKSASVKICSRLNGNSTTENGSGNTIRARREVASW
ncbi:hypothetical protein EV644_107282 [Kribbella orskensis]|uniref:Uncharacterized protein n=1 Tax=Kribbella orskensis TaxID=2512216 RepID=A0ABY2BLQ7_9ACTN|nr:MULTISPECIES: hypothetical protein [Kribbella]TCN39310.1 hypothetical protein EV642_107282 [Kribbella sp. VKM Ac-2500]TCO21957.1 hypothetical protein EV644_107282 [Kribbella orskensis]